MHSLGLPEIFVLLFVLSVAGGLLVLPACLICRRAGYPGWLGIGAVIPLVNILWFCFLGFQTWPIERKVLRPNHAG